MIMIYIDGGRVRIPNIRESGTREQKKMKLCLTTVVDDKYMAYLPLFVFCANKAYPNYIVRLFIRNRCPYNLKAWRLHCELIPLFENFPRYEYMSIALRFVIDKTYFADCDFVYITDIDMMIMREHRDIEYFHRMEMSQTKLCYSNSLRNAAHYAGNNSLTGLHFASRAWFEKTNDLSAEYRMSLREGLIGTYREYDGVMLYRIADRGACGLPGKYKLTKRHHGIHLGNFRIFGTNKLKLDTRISIEHRVKWLQYLCNKVFQDICTTCKCDNTELVGQLTALELFCNGKL